MFLGMNLLKNWTKIDLSDNYISSRGLLYMSDILKSQKLELNSIILKNNTINDKGIENLVNCILFDELLKKKGMKNS